MNYIDGILANAMRCSLVPERPDKFARKIMRMIRKRETRKIYPEFPKKILDNKPTSWYNMPMNGSETREKIIETAYSIILEKSFPAASVDEICRAAGVSKGSFFHHFKSKEDLGIVVLEWYYKRAMRIVGMGPFTKEKDPMKRLFMFLDHADSVARELWEKGCLLGSFASYMAAIGPQLAGQVAALFNNLVQNLAPLFEPLVVKTASKDGLTAVELSEQFLNVIEGSIVLSRAYDDWKHVPIALKNFRRYLLLLLD